MMTCHFPYQRTFSDILSIRCALKIKDDLSDDSCVNVTWFLLLSSVVIQHFLDVHLETIRKIKVNVMNELELERMCV